MPYTHSLDVTIETPDHYFGGSALHLDDAIKDLVAKHFPEADKKGSGGGFGSRDIDWEIDHFRTQAQIDAFGSALLALDPARVFHVHQWAYDSLDDVEDWPDDPEFRLGHLHGAEGVYFMVS